MNTNVRHPGTKGLGGGGGGGGGGGHSRMRLQDPTLAEIGAGRSRSCEDVRVKAQLLQLRQPLQFR